MMKKYRFFPFLFLIVLGFMITGCGKADQSSSQGDEKKSETLTITHPLGKTKVEKNPEKIVVFDFGMLDTLDLMGIEVTGVPQANIPPYLEKYKDKKYVNVGSLKEPDFEKIAEIDPDLIIISGRQSDLYEEFTKLGPTVYMGLDPSRYLDSFKENVQTLGKIFGKEAFVNDEIAKIEEKIAQVKKKAEEANKNALILLANEGKVSAFGPGSRFGLIHDVLGFKPVDPNIEVSTHGQSVSFEYILEKNPDYLFVVDRTAVVGGKTNAKDTVENELVKKTKAYQEGHIVYLDPNFWYLSGGGLVSVREMIEEVENSLP